MKRPPNKSKHPSICLSRIALLKVTDFQRILNHFKKNSHFDFLPRGLDRIGVLAHELYLLSD